MSRSGAAAGVAFAWGLLSGLESMRPLLPEYGYFEVHFDWVAASARSLLAAAFRSCSGLRRRCVRAAGHLRRLEAARAESGRRRGRALGESAQSARLSAGRASMVLLLLTGFVVVGWQRSAGVESASTPRISIG